ncbi:MAG: anaerobic ribonucleoside-triphosphate reductase activating protein [Clostridia bacterium]|nr:anaerobic ribonucleoside-triphosphate reductase activating protein [Clostridia bacterium]MBQ6848502.1 anaerobic ribonucleoside-triphosphate reductase activating protein [Clostridia bacterium]
MNIQGFQKLTLLDYPGRTACTVFTGGCNLRCPFCHNADLVRTPMAGPNLTDEVLTYLARRQGILDGVCITGGEPLLQPDLVDFIRQVKELGYGVKLDTNGSLPDRLAALLDTGLVDYVAMDVKSSPAGYAAVAGVDTEWTVFDRSIRILRDSGVNHEFRTTAVGGLHTPEDFAAIGGWLAGTSAYYIQRFVDSGRLLGEGFYPFSVAEMEHLLTVVRERIPTAQLRGC